MQINVNVQYKNSSVGLPYMASHEVCPIHHTPLFIDTVLPFDSIGFPN